MRRILALLLFAPSLFAASEYPPSFRWRTITTEHFYVHYHQGEEQLAQRAAGYAESAHDRLVPLIGWEPHERTNIILADHVDLSNGSANPFPNNRIEIYVTAPGGDPSSPIQNYDNWLNLVITHEYTHILHLDQARGFARGVRSILGRNPLLAFPSIFSPLWFIEGLATLAETEETTSGRLKGTYLDMILRTAAIEDRWSTEAQAAGLGPDWPAGNTRYYYGAKFLSWLSITRGEDKLRLFMNNFSANVIPFRVNASAEDVYGVSMAHLWEQWAAEQQQAYRLELERLRAEGLTQHERITQSGYRTDHTILSPGGTHVAYTSQGPYEQATIRVRDLDANRDVHIHPINETSPLSWRADGRAIAYSDIEFVGSFSLLSDLYIWDFDRGTERITDGARLRDPAFTPDGKKLIAIENTTGRNRIVEVDIASGDIKPLITPTDDRQFEEPAVSHDGNRIAVAEWRNGAVDIVLYTRDGQLIRNLTQSPNVTVNASPRFSRDDQKIWFSSDITGIPNIYSVNISGEDLRRLTNVYGGALYPTSIDGRKFWYSNYSADGFDVARMEVTRDYPIVQRTIPKSVMGTAPHPAVSPRSDATSSDSAYSAWRTLRPRWWFPVLGSASINGSDEPYFGLVTSGGDVLGYHSYSATLTNRLYGIVYAYDRFYPTITVAASQFHDNFTTGGSEVTSITDRVVGLATFPYRQVQWQTSGSIGFIHDHLHGDVPPGLFTGTLHGLRAGAFFNSAREYLYSISPEHGVSANVDYENLKGDASLQTMRGDVRGYITIPYSNSPLGRHVLALRAAGGKNTGDFILQRELRVGGESAGEFTTLDIRNFPVRGFDEGTLRGQSASIGSIEYRFPIYEIDRGPTTFPLYFNRVHGDVFGDAGRASGDHIASTGLEGSIDFIVANALFIRLRTGFAVRLTDPDKGKVVPYISIGSSF